MGEHKAKAIGQGGFAINRKILGMFNPRLYAQSIYIPDFGSFDSLDFFLVLTHTPPPFIIIISRHGHHHHHHLFPFLTTPW